MGAIVEVEKRTPCFFRASRDFDVGGPCIGLRARITRKALKPRGVRTFYAVVSPSGSFLAEVRIETVFIGKTAIVPARGKPMELHMKGLRRFEVVSLESKVKIAAGSPHMHKGVRIALELSPNVPSEWQVLIMTATLAFDSTRKIRSAFFSSFILSRFLTRQFLRN